LSIRLLIVFLEIPHRQNIKEENRSFYFSVAFSKAFYKMRYKCIIVNKCICFHFIVYCNRDYSCFNLQAIANEPKLNSIVVGKICVVPWEIDNWISFNKSCFNFFEVSCHFQDLFYQQNYPEILQRYPMMAMIRLPFSYGKGLPVFSIIIGSKYERWLATISPCTTGALPYICRRMPSRKFSILIKSRNISAFREVVSLFQNKLAK
jgi:hypothetical protein